MNRHNSQSSVSFASPTDGISPREENGYAYWLERLKSRKAMAISHSGCAISATDKTDNTSSVGFVGASGEVQAGEIAWRVAAMRPQIPLRGPIPFLVARLDLVTSCAPGHCGSCGEPLHEGQRFRCSPCQEAAWLALNEVREGVPA
jgi:hypothetical protein